MADVFRGPKYTDSHDHFGMKELHERAHKLLTGKDLSEEPNNEVPEELKVSEASGLNDPAGLEMASEANRAKIRAHTELLMEAYRRKLAGSGLQSSFDLHYIPRGQLLEQQDAPKPVGSKSPFALKMEGTQGARQAHAGKEPGGNSARKPLHFPDIHSALAYYRARGNPGVQTVHGANEGPSDSFQKLRAALLHYAAEAARVRSEGASSLDPSPSSSNEKVLGSAESRPWKQVLKSYGAEGTDLKSIDWGLPASFLDEPIRDGMYEPGPDMPQTMRELLERIASGQDGYLSRTEIGMGWAMTRGMPAESVLRALKLASALWHQNHQPDLSFLPTDPKLFDGDTNRALARALGVKEDAGKSTNVAMDMLEYLKDIYPVAWKSSSGGGGGGG